MEPSTLFYDAWEVVSAETNKVLGTPSPLLVLALSIPDFSETNTTEARLWEDGLWRCTSIYGGKDAQVVYVRRRSK